jgi:hypothetical protein
MANATVHAPQIGAQSGSMAERAARLMAAHPGHVPVIVENACKDHELINAKFMASREMRVSHFMLIVRKRLRPAPPASVALYVFCGKSESIPASAQSMGELYDREKDAENLLRVKLCRENTFG